MTTPIDPRHLGPAEHAAYYQALRRDAAALRQQAIADAFGALRGALARLLARTRTLPHATTGRPLHQPPYRSA